MFSGLVFAKNFLQIVGFFFKGEYILPITYYKMSFTICNGEGEELLKLHPVEFRRMYTLTFDHATHIPSLEYSNTDCICRLDGSEATVMCEIVQGMMEDGTYVIKCSPSDLTFPFRLRKNGRDCIAYLKRIIFMNWPDLPNSNVYLNEKLQLTRN